MANLSEINNAFSNRLSSWVETPIAWDNVDYTPEEGQEWIRAVLLPSSPENNELGLSVINYGLFWIQIFVPKLIGTGRAYELATMLVDLFSNTQFDDIVCYTADVQRSGDNENNWFQLNVRIKYWSHERTD
jgi:hypothetical protein